MKEIVRSVSAKGQVTLPIEVRRILGIAPRGKVAIGLLSVRRTPLKSGVLLTLCL